MSAFSHHYGEFQAVLDRASDIYRRVFIAAIRSGEPEVDRRAKEAVAKCLAATGGQLQATVALLRDLLECVEAPITAAEVLFRAARSSADDPSLQTAMAATLKLHSERLFHHLQALITAALPAVAKREAAAADAAYRAEGLETPVELRTILQSPGAGKLERGTAASTSESAATPVLTPSSAESRTITWGAAAKRLGVFNSGDALRVACKRAGEGRGGQRYLAGIWNNRTQIGSVRSQPRVCDVEAVRAELTRGADAPSLRRRR